MSCSKDDNSKIKSEIEDLENLRLGESKNNNATKFGQCNATQYLREKKQNKKQRNISDNSRIGRIRIN